MSNYMQRKFDNLTFIEKVRVAFVFYSGTLTVGTIVALMCLIIAFAFMMQGYGDMFYATLSVVFAGITGCIVSCLIYVVLTSADEALKNCEHSLVEDMLKNSKG